MKKHWKLVLILSAVLLLVSITAGTALGAIKISSIKLPNISGLRASNVPVPAGNVPTQITVMAGGNTTGTWAIDLTQAADGTLTPLPPGSCTPGVSTAGPCSNSEPTIQTMGNYITPDKDGYQEVYVNTYLSNSSPPTYGLYKFTTTDGGHTLLPDAVDPFDQVTLPGAGQTANMLTTFNNQFPLPTSWPYTQWIIGWLNGDNPTLMNLAQQMDNYINSRGISGTLFQDYVGTLTSYPLPAMFCSTDLASQTEDPRAGNLEVGDMATGINYFYNMTTKTWVATVGGNGTVNDLSFREGGGDGDLSTTGDNNDEAWSSGHNNNIYHLTNYSGTAMSTGAMTLDATGSRTNAGTLLHQSRTFTLDGTEYVVIADGSSVDLLFIKTSDNNDANGPKSNWVTSGRFHVFNQGEIHSIGLNIPYTLAGGNSGVTVNPDPDGNPATDDGYGINGVVPGFTDGSLTGVSIYHDSTGNLRVAVKNKVPGTGTIADICGLDIVSSNGQWVRN